MTGGPVPRLPGLLKAGDRVRDQGRLRTVVRAAEESKEEGVMTIWFKPLKGFSDHLGVSCDQAVYVHESAQ